MTLIVFVCRGNTCRSPMAEAYARHAAAARGLVGVSFASAGVAPSAIGAGRSMLATAVLDAAHVPHGAHRTRQLTHEVAAAADMILAFDAGVAEEARVLAGTDAHKVMPLMAFAPHLGGDVPDPYGGTRADYDAAFARMRAAVDVLVERIAILLAGRGQGSE